MSIIKQIDANVVLRYLMRDNEELYHKAEKIIRFNPCISMCVLAEVVYVLKGIYKVSKEEIADTLITLSDEVEYENGEIAIETLCNFKKYNLDFVDCYLIARKTVNGEEIISFDKDLNDKLSKLICKNISK